MNRSEPGVPRSGAGDASPRSSEGRTRGDPRATQFGDEWQRQADYVLPSTEFEVVDAGVVRPSADGDPRLREAVRAASNHCLVWVEVAPTWS